MDATIIQRVREFNRFYTRILGLLDAHFLGSPFTLPEARVLYELHHQQPCLARDLAHDLGMDKGYLSRILASFERKGLLKKHPDQTDRRQTRLSLTTTGTKAFRQIDQASINQLKEILGFLSPADAERLLTHMNAIREQLNRAI